MSPYSVGRFPVRLLLFMDSRESEEHWDSRGLRGSDSTLLSSHLHGRRHL